VLFDAAVGAFFLFVTSPAHLARFDRVAARGASARPPYLVQSFCKRLGFMGTVYARSIALAGDHMLVTAGPGFISHFAHRTITRATRGVELLAAYKNRAWKVSSGAMNDVMWHDGWWYITQTRTCAVYRLRELPRILPVPPPLPTLNASEAFAHAERVKHQLLNALIGVCALAAPACSGGGTPYYLSVVGSRVYVPYIFGCSGVHSFVPLADPVRLAASTVKHFNATHGWQENDADVAVRGTEW
jgi:hypothetical protein